MLQGEVFVGKLCSIYRFAACAITCRKVPTLAHEIGYYSVESTALEMKGFARFPGSFLTSAQTPEILCCFGCNICPELHHNSASCGAANGHIEENLWVRHF